MVWIFPLSLKFVMVRRKRYDCYACGSFSKLIVETVVGVWWARAQTTR